jgi:hypothetical protein
MINPILTGGKFVSAKEFDGQGKTLKITAEPELVTCSNPKYGFQEGVNKGKTVRYSFHDGNTDRLFESKAIRFAKAIEPFGVGDTVQIKRHAAGTDTQYEVKKADDLSSIPF